ncbi:hypothetical protein BC940DRAFT_356009 [Gongronella butleri]|nr:hypothetical protein BC940DRAFT_356009 [Gongronella butleri]
MVSLPENIVRLIIENLWQPGVLEARLVSRAWSAIASEIASGGVMFQFHKLEQMVQHVRAGGTTQITIKGLEAEWRLIGMNRREADRQVTEWSSLCNKLLPFLRDADTFAFDLTLVGSLTPFDNDGAPFNSLLAPRRRRFTMISKLVQLPRLRVLHLWGTTNEMINIAPFLSCSLREITISRDEGHSCDLRFMMALLGRLPQLQKLELGDVSSLKLNGMQLCDFIHTSLVDQPLHLNLDQLSLNVCLLDKQEPLAVMGLLYFLLFVMPNVKDLSIVLESQFRDSTGIITSSSINHERLPAPIISFPAKLSVVTTCFTFVPSSADLMSASLFRSDGGIRVLESLHLKDRCCALLALLPLAHAKSLVINGSIYDAPQSQLSLVNVPLLKSIEVAHVWIKLPVVVYPYPPDMLHAIGPCVQVWLTHTNNPVAQSLSEDEISILLLRLLNHKNQLIGGTHMPTVIASIASSPLVDIAFDRLCVSQRATVYACTSIVKFTVNKPRSSIF